jgi:hypothetical protein
VTKEQEILKYKNKTHQHHQTPEQTATLSFFIINEVKREFEVSIQEALRITKANHLCLSGSVLALSTARSSASEYLASDPGAGLLWV